MKLTIIGPTFPFKGGISHFTTLFVHHLRKQHQVDFITLNSQYPRFLYPVDQRDHHSRLKITEESQLGWVYYNPRSWIAVILRIIKDRPAKLILTWVGPVQGPMYFLLSVFVKLFSQTEIIYLCHNVIRHEQKFLDNVLMKFAFAPADTFIVHSEEDATKLRLLVNGKKIVIAFHPIYDVFNLNQKINKDNVRKELGLSSRVLLFFGYIRPYKGLSYLIGAMSNITKAHPDTSLLVVGEFWKNDKEKYLQMVSRLGLKNKVAFVDHYVPNEEVEKYFRLCDVVVLPYLSATQSGIIQIAYAFNKPVISTAVGGLKDAIVDGKTGYVIKPAAADDIAAKVDKFFKHPIGVEGIKEVRKKFSWENYVNVAIS